MASYWLVLTSWLAPWDAGIPTASGGSVGQRLRLCLKHRPHEFVSVVMSELQAAFQPASSSNGRRSRRGGDEVAEKRRSMLEDIIYYWMLAEAYVQHPAIQADMRCVRQLATIAYAASVKCVHACSHKGSLCMLSNARTVLLCRGICMHTKHHTKEEGVCHVAGRPWGGRSLCRWTTMATSSTGKPLCSLNGPHMHQSRALTASHPSVYCYSGDSRQFVCLPLGSGCVGACSDVRCPSDAVGGHCWGGIFYVHVRLRSRCVEHVCGTFAHKNCVVYAMHPGWRTSARARWVRWRRAATRCSCSRACSCWMRATLGST